MLLINLILHYYGMAEEYADGHISQPTWYLLTHYALFLFPTLLFFIVPSILHHTSFPLIQLQSLLFAFFINLSLFNTIILSFFIEPLFSAQPFAFYVCFWCVFNRCCLKLHCHSLKPYYPSLRLCSFVVSFFYLE